MKTLTSTLEAAQRSSSGKPYIEALVADYEGYARRARPERVYSGSDPSDPVAAAIAPDGSLLRLRRVTQAATLELQVRESADDSYENSGINEPDADFGWLADADDEYAGYRWQGVAVPRGATILKATFHVVWPSIQSPGDPLGTLYGDDADDSAQFTTGTNDISGRTATTATVAIDESALLADSVTFIELADVTAIVQEIVDRAGWASGHALSLLYQASADGGRDFSTMVYDDDPALAAKLLITYATGTPQATAYVSRVAAPDAESDFSSWSSLDAEISALGGVALAVDSDTCYAFMVDDDLTTIVMRTSTDHGASWGSRSTVTSAGGVKGALAAAAAGDDDIVLFYAEADGTVYAVRWGGSSWGSPAAWTNSLWRVTGLACCYLLDWQVVVTGISPATAYERGVWACRFGDGVNQTVNTWGALRDVTTAAAGSEVAFQGPSVAVSDVFRLYFVEQYGASSVLQLEIGASSDDAHEISGGSMFLTSSPLGASLDNTNEWAGLRFGSVPLPAGAVIESAVLSVVPGDSGNDEPLVTIYCEAADDAATFTTANSNISSRSRTSASVAWDDANLGADGSTYFDAPDLAALVQEVVDRPGWAEGNAMAVLIRGSGTSSRDLTLVAYDGDPALSARLELRYRLPEGGYQRQQWTTLALTHDFNEEQWREPVAFDFEDGHGVAAVAEGAALWLASAAGVWLSALPAFAELDVSAGVVEARVRADDEGAVVELELNNADGAYTAYGAGALGALQRGARLQLTPGYSGTAGAETPLPYGYWVESLQLITGARPRLKLRARDAWSLLGQWRARRQLAWAAGEKSVSQLLLFLVARAGVEYSSSGGSDALTALRPAFTVHAGETGLTAVRRLLALIEDVGYWDGDALRVTLTAGDDASTYDLGPSGEGEPAGHAVVEAVYGDPGPSANRVRVVGLGAYGEAFDFADAARFEKVRTVVDLNLTEDAEAAARAAAALRQAQLEAVDDELRLFGVHCGVELYDIVDVTDAQVGLEAATRRVLGYSWTYEPRRGRYDMTLTLGAV